MHASLCNNVAADQASDACYQSMKEFCAASVRQWPLIILGHAVSRRLARLAECCCSQSKLVTVLKTMLLTSASSAATSEELESLLQQLAVYEERLLQAEPSVVATSPDDAVNEGASTMGTSMASVSWSQTLAGLASLLPQG